MDREYRLLIRAPGTTARCGFLAANDQAALAEARRLARTHVRPAAIVLDRIQWEATGLTIVAAYADAPAWWAAGAGPFERFLEPALEPAGAPEPERIEQAAELQAADNVPDPEGVRFWCPQCKKTNCIDVSATVWVRITENSLDNVQTDADESMDGSHYWDDDAAATCCDCGFSGTVADFDNDEAIIEAKMREEMREQMGLQKEEVE